MNGNWRFPASNHAKNKGTSTGDSETFRKSPYKSFAREILQNSIDAKDTNKKTVRVEFNEFVIPTKDIPGFNEYKTAIKNILEYWNHKQEYVDEYKDILKSLDNKTTKCLRISDYNTTGLIGVNSSELEGNKFMALAMGSGVSEKDNRVAAGSKGVGKNAAFELSKYKMVFYSTKTSSNEQGSLGVTELISGYVDDDHSENRDHTQGTGYYGSDNLNTSLKELIKLDPKQKDRNENGTDIYIVGFESDSGWEKEIINSLLDSFMASIVNNDLEINFNGIEIKSDNVNNIINSDYIFENNMANIYSQYKLLKGGSNIKVFDIETEFGTPKLYIWPVPEELSNYATHECTMIRYPLMKIKTFPINKSFKVSAMCIIEDDELGKLLRNIENPQHTDWEEKRIKDSSIRKAVSRAINEIREQLNDRVIECLKLTDDNPIDPYGAGEYLPEVDFDGSNGKKPNDSISDNTQKVTISKRKESKTIEKKNMHDNGDSFNGINPFVGNQTDEDTDDEIEHPGGHNNHSGNDSHAGEETSGLTEGDNVVYRRAILNGVKYKVIAINKNSGEYKVVFVAPGDYENCYLNVLLVDDANKKYNVDILEMKCDDKLIESEDSIEFGPFSISENKKTVLYIKVNEKSYFASEVKIICK